MKMVIVSIGFTWNGTERSYDMEIPCHVPANTLIDHISQTLANYSEGKYCLPKSGLRLYCRRLERDLQPGETFEQAGIWNGDHVDIK